MATATPGRMDDLARLKESFNKGTTLPKKVEFIFTDNMNAFELDLSNWLDDLNAGKKVFVRHEAKMGVARFWHKFVMMAKHDWVVLINDDVICTPGWDEQLRKLITSNPSFGVFLVAFPQPFSGFAVNKEFYNKYGPFRQEYTGGGREDEDFFLSVTVKTGCKSKKEVHAKYIYPVERVRSIYKVPPFTHTPQRHSVYHFRWNHGVNTEVFGKYWERVDPSSAGALESWKRGRFYRPRKGLANES